MNHQTYSKRARQYLHCLANCNLLAEPAQMLFRATPPGCYTTQDILVLAPVMNSFVIWVLQNATKSGVKRLYFLARDGYLPYLTAKKYCDALQLPIECRYFHCSRYSLRIPMYHQDPSEALSHICRGGIRVTTRKLMSRAGFSHQEANTLLPLLDLGYGPDDAIPYHKLAFIRQKLADCPLFLERMAQLSRDALPGLKGYFAQEGLLDEIPCGLVDSGWTGTMQKSIQDIRKLCGCQTPLQGYYFGIYSLPAQCNPSCYHSFFFSQKQGLFRKIFFNNNLFEDVYTAPHGTTTGYACTPQGVIPLTSEADPRIRQFMEVSEPLMMAYTDCLLQNLSPETFQALPIAHMTHTIASLLRMLMWNPTKSEALTFGSLPFSDDLLDNNMQELAAPLTPAQLRNNHVLHKLLLMTGLRKGIVQESAWYEASAVRYGRHPAWHRINYTLYKLLLYLKPR